MRKPIAQFFCRYKYEIGSQKDHSLLFQMHGLFVQFEGGCGLID